MLKTLTISTVFMALELGITILIMEMGQLLNIPQDTVTLVWIAQIYLVVILISSYYFEKSKR